MPKKVMSVPNLDGKYPMEAAGLERSGKACPCGGEVVRYVWSDIGFCEDCKTLYSAEEAIQLTDVRKTARR